MNSDKIFNIASKKHVITLLGLILAASTVNAFAYTGQKFAREAKISMEQARVIALKAHPGNITDEELEQEKGGSGLRYSFDIRRGKVTQEVGVDAQTGKVLENDPEGPNAD
ncbi:MAG: PepSY domain-containing protein [Burkholderiales bacterium]